MLERERGRERERACGEINGETEEICVCVIEREEDFPENPNWWSKPLFSTIKKKNLLILRFLLLCLVFLNGVRLMAALVSDEK